MSRLAPTRIRLFAVVAVLVLIAGYAIAMGPSHRSPTGADGIARVGLEAPELSVTLEDGSVARLSSVVQGRRAVVVFYSPVCGVCEVTLPALYPFPASLQLVMVDVSGAAKARSSSIRSSTSRRTAAAKPCELVSRGVHADDTAILVHVRVLG